MQAAPGASSEMLSVLRAEHTADRVQTLGVCEGMGGREGASAEAFKALHEGQQGASEAQVALSLPPLSARACAVRASLLAVSGLGLPP